MFESLWSSLKPLCAALTLLSTGVLRIPVILTGENSLVVKQPFKTKCSVERELAAALCAFFEMSADLKGGSSDLLSFGLLWCIFVASLGGFLKVLSNAGAQCALTSASNATLELWKVIWDLYCWKRSILKESLCESNQVWEIYITKFAHTCCKRSVWSVSQRGLTLWQKQSKIILGKQCNESFCVPGSLPQNIHQTVFRVLWWDEPGAFSAVLNSGQSPLGFHWWSTNPAGPGQFGQDCFRRWTIKLNVLKHESKCPAGVWAVPRGSYRAQKVSFPLSMDLVQWFPPAGQKSLDSQPQRKHQELFEWEKNRRLLTGKSFLEQSGLEWC